LSGQREKTWEKNMFGQERRQGTRIEKRGASSKRGGPGGRETRRQAIVKEIWPNVG